MTEWFSIENPPEKNGMDYTYLLSDGKQIGIGWYEPEFFEEDDPEWAEKSGISYSSDMWHEDSSMIGEVKFWAHLPNLPE
jgi:hypothetical protein